MGKLDRAAFKHGNIVGYILGTSSPRVLLSSLVFLWWHMANTNFAEELLRSPKLESQYLFLP
jgi:hypothetical protein